MRVFTGLCVLALIALSAGDSYLHGPRGSNNRLNEQAANRNNADRLFDSQNNNRGGYNVGDKTTNAFDANNPDEEDLTVLYDVTDAGSTKQYSLAYYEESVVQIEWTNQHGCGGNEADDPYILNCNILLQFMCDIDQTTDPTNALTVNLKDGGNTNTPTEPNTFADTDPDNDQDDNEGHHESSGWYYECKMTDRNMRLFHADQNLNGDDARYTRQNPNGDRRGLECPEERDYYPYWRPTPWVDIAYLTDIVLEGDNVEDNFCDYIQEESQNVADKCKCLGPVQNNQQAPITEAGCDTAGGSWTCRWAFDLDPPVCENVQFSRANHLGNGRFNQMLNYNWTVPTLDDLQAFETFANGDYTAKKCVLRLRYNISTDDYDPWKTNSTWDDDPDNGIASPVTENPTVDVGANLIGLKLAINTAQFGRTFQDRTHIFYIMERPSNIDGNVYNLNVRGKRGNIVQTYPAMEYDFQPNRIHIEEGDWLHIQWTGSNTHNNGNPGGDGQTGDAGEGTGGTDRSNFAQLDEISQNWPIPLDKYDKNIFTEMKTDTCYNLDGSEIGDDWVDCAVVLATSGQYRDGDGPFNNFNPTLDNAPASLIGGVLMQPGEGTYNYMCTRNNNFSNRSQKGTIIVEDN